MSIIIEIPVTSSPLQTATVFNANWNNPTVNKYDWGKAANVNIPIATLKNPFIYLLSGVAFSCDIPEGEFKQSISTIPLLQLNLLSTKAQIFQNRVPFINYVDNQEYVYFFNSPIKPDSLTGTFTGVLNQIPATVGDLIIKAQIQLNMYEIKDSRWQAKYFDPKTDLGSRLKTRGVARVPRKNVRY